MKRTTLALFVGASLLFGGATDSMSQQFTGSIRGAVRDAQGIIPGVTVTLTNEGTTVARDTITNEVGEYAFVAVPPSAYSIRTSLPGYKTYEQRGLNIGTAQAITLDLILEVGTVEIHTGLIAIRLARGRAERGAVAALVTEIGQHRDLWLLVGNEPGGAGDGRRSVDDGERG